MPLTVDPQVTATFRFKTHLIEAANGAEVARASRTEYLSELALTDLKFRECQTSAAYAEFRDFFVNKAKGRLNTFRFKNPLDYKLPANTQAVGQYTSISTKIIAGSAPATRLVLKQYDFGTVRGFKSIRYLDLNKSVVLKNNINVTAACSISSGELLIPGAIATDAISVSGEFYLPYRFADDKYNVEQLSNNLISVKNIRLIEDPQTSVAPWLPSDFVTVGANNPFTLGFEPTYAGEVRVESYQDSLDNNETVTVARLTEAKSDINYLGNVLKCEEKDSLLAIFNACKGRLIRFYLEDTALARFNTDELTLTNLVIQKSVNK
jgi:hypothetical protein